MSVVWPMRLTQSRRASPNPAPISALRGAKQNPLNWILPGDRQATSAKRSGSHRFAGPYSAPGQSPIFRRGAGDGFVSVGEIASRLSRPAARARGRDSDGPGARADRCSSPGTFDSSASGDDGRDTDASGTPASQTSRATRSEFGKRMAASNVACCPSNLTVEKSERSGKDNFIDFRDQFPDRCDFRRRGDSNMCVGSPGLDRAHGRHADNAVAKPVAAESECETASNFGQNFRRHINPAFVPGEKKIRLGCFPAVVDPKPIFGRLPDLLFDRRSFRGDRLHRFAR